MHEHTHARLFDLYALCYPLRRHRFTVDWRHQQQQQHHHHHQHRKRATRTIHNIIYTSIQFSFIKPIVQSARASVVVSTSYRLDVGFLLLSHFLPNI